MSYPGYDNAYDGYTAPVSTVVAGELATVVLAAPEGAPSCSANVAAPLASEIYNWTAHPGDVSTSSATSNDVELSASVATVLFDAPRGALAASSSTGIEMPVGEAATSVLAAPVGAVSATTGAAPGGAAVGSVDGAVATSVLAAPAGAVATTPHVNGPVATIALTAPVGAVATYTVDRAELVLTMALIDESVPSQPGTLRVGIYNGTAYATVYFFLDGAGTPFHSAALDDTGSATVPLPINNLTVGQHTVRVGSTTALPTASAVNNKAFQVAAAPAPVAASPTPRTPPKPPSAPINHWVFQAYDFSDRNNVETYTLPVNPREYEPSYGGYVISSEPTTVSSGTVVSWEGQAPPEIMRWSGRTLTKEDYEALLKVGVTGQRVWVTDHFRRRFLVKIASFAPQRVRDRARPWHHEYEMTAWVLEDLTEEDLSTAIWPTGTTLAPRSDDPLDDLSFSRSAVWAFPSREGNAAEQAYVSYQFTNGATESVRAIASAFTDGPRNGTSYASTTGVLTQGLAFYVTQPGPIYVVWARWGQFDVSKFEAGLQGATLVVHEPT